VDKPVDNGARASIGAGFFTSLKAMPLQSNTP